MVDQSGKVAIVTGASRGIGAAVAERLGRDGFAVIVNYAGNKQAADRVVDTITKAGGRAQAVQGDVADVAAARALFDAAESAFGGVDVLVNNAGIMILSPVGETKDDDFARQVDVNVKGTFNTMREAAKRMRDGGRVINCSSAVVHLLMPHYAVYAATKAAVEAMTTVFAKEMRGRDITVNAFAPGPTETDLFMTGKTPETIDRLAKMSPLERLGQPKDIADVVSFLAGPDGGWVNGQTVRANGGIV